MRVSVQLRDGFGRRWARSIYVGPAAATEVIPFAEFLPTDPASPRIAPLATMRTMLFVVDLTNAEPGTSGSLSLSGLRLER